MLAAGVVIVALAVGLAVVLAKLAGARRVLHAVAGVSPWWLLLCLVTESVSYLGYTVLLRDVAAVRDGPRIGWWRSVRAVFASLGATRLIAAAGAGGLAVYYWILRQAGMRARDARGRVLALNILVFGVFGLLAAAAGAVALAVPWLARAHPWPMAVAWVVAVPACLLGGFWVGNPARGWLLDERPGEGRRRVAARAVLDGLRVARAVAVHPHRHRGLGLAAAGYWAGDVACLWGGLAAVGVFLTPVEVMLAYATGYVAMLAPLPTGGFGAVDAAVTFALLPIGVPLASALVGVAVWRAFSFWLPTLPALVALAGLRELGRELRSAAS